MKTLAHTRVCTCGLLCGMIVARRCRQQPDHAEPGGRSKGACALFYVLWGAFAVLQRVNFVI